MNAVHLHTLHFRERVSYRVTSVKLIHTNDDPLNVIPIMLHSNVTLSSTKTMEYFIAKIITIINRTLKLFSALENHSFNSTIVVTVGTSTM